MRRNKRRQMELGLIALAFSTLALLYLVLAIGFIQIAKTQQPNTQTVITPTDHRPDISHCFKEDEQRELWDCIRHADG